MNRSLWRRAMALTLAASMSAGLAACGGGSSTSGSSKGDEHYFKATYLSDLPESFNSNVQNVTFQGDVMYYGTYDDNYEKYGIYSYNMVTKDSAQLYEFQENNTDGSYNSVSDYVVGEDGSLYLSIYKSEIDESSVGDQYDNATLEDVLNFLENDWGYSAEDAQSTWDDAYAPSYTDENGNVDYRGFLVAMSAGRINTQTIAKIDADGNQVFEVNMSDSDDASNNVSCNAMATDKDGNIYAAMNEWTDTTDDYFVSIYDKDGNMKGKVKLDGYCSNLLTLSDGSVATLGWADEGGNELVPIDASSGKLKEDAKISVPSDSVVILDDKNVLVTESSALYKYNIDT